MMLYNLHVFLEFIVLPLMISHDFGPRKASSVERKNMKLASKSCGAEFG